MDFIYTCPGIPIKKPCFSLTVGQKSFDQFQKLKPEPLVFWFLLKTSSGKKVVFTWSPPCKTQI